MENKRKLEGTRLRKEQPKTTAAMAERKKG
jgi:hypothetical protein